MEHLTATQLTLLLAAVGLVSAFVGWLGRGLTFVLKRWWTGIPQQEEATYLHSVADLLSKLRANGMTLADVRSFAAIMRNPAVVSSEAATQAVEKLANEGEPDAFSSNVAMKARTGASYDVADAKLEQAMMDLRLLVRPDEEGLLLDTHEAWKRYRTLIEDRALREYVGGTHATLAMALAGLAETERRTEEVRAEVAARAAL